MKRFLFYLFLCAFISTLILTLWAVWELSAHIDHIGAGFSHLAQMVAPWAVLAVLGVLGYWGYQQWKAHKTQMLDWEVKQTEIDEKRHRMRLEQQRFKLTRELALAGKLDGSNVEVSETKLTRFLSAGRVTINQEPTLPAQLAPLSLPGPTLMIDVMRRWNLSQDNLFLGLGKGQRDIACSLDGFMHVAHDAPTGQGKTAQAYAEIIMLLKIGVRVILANPHFAPVGKKGEDWRPVGQAIERQGKIEIAPGVFIPGLLRKPVNIANMLLWLASTEIDRRFDMMARGDYRYTPLYLFIDEWPYIVSQVPQAGPALVNVLQRGRAVEVCVDTNSQGFLIGDTDLKGSARENINTAYHMGGSVHSGAALLDMPVKDINALLKTEQIALGRGIALLRNNQVAQQAELVRLPYANNEYAYYMLGRADDWTLPEFRDGKHVSPLTDAMAVEQDDPSTRRERETDVSPLIVPREAARESVVSLTEQERLTIIAVARAQLKASGKAKINRSQLLESQGWNNRMWPKVKQVLDEEGM